MSFARKVLVGEQLLFLVPIDSVRWVGTLLAFSYEVTEVNLRCVMWPHSGLKPVHDTYEHFQRITGSGRFKKGLFRGSCCYSRYTYLCRAPTCNMTSRKLCWIPLGDTTILWIPHNTQDAPLIGETWLTFCLNTEEQCMTDFQSDVVPVSFLLLSLALPKPTWKKGHHSTLFLVHVRQFTCPGAWPEKSINYSGFPSWLKSRSRSDPRGKPLFPHRRLFLTRSLSLLFFVFICPGAAHPTHSDLKALWEPDD